MSLLIALLIILSAFTLILFELRSTPEKGRPFLGFFIRLIHILCLIIHRAKWIGTENLPHKIGPEGLLLISNHSCSLDPALLQCPSKVYFRWLMADEMFWKPLMFFWKWVGVISVDRKGVETKALREAIRWIRQGNAIGIFPEGGIYHDPKGIHPFKPGIGLMIKKTKAPVIIANIRGTPKTNQVLQGIFKPSRAEIRYARLWHPDRSLSAQELTLQARTKMAELAEWPFDDTLQKDR